MPPALPPPSRADRAWLASVLGADAKTLRLRRLDGGITSAVHDVAILDANRKPRRYVLRRYTGADHESPVVDVRREAAILTGLAASGLPAPRLIAFDAEAEHCSAPALLMTRLPGRMLLRPADPDDWLRQLAALLPRIHAAQVDAPPAEIWVDPADLTTHDWSSDDGMWQAAFELFHGGPPDGDRCFSHRDYQQFNLLWTGQSLSGVVDWVFSSYGSPDIDVAHCRAEPHRRVLRRDGRALSEPLRGSRGPPGGALVGCRRATRVPARLGLVPATPGRSPAHHRLRRNARAGRGQPPSCARPRRLSYQPRRSTGQVSSTVPSASTRCIRSCSAQVGSMWAGTIRTRSPTAGCGAPSCIE
jgi:aminoglycoside phosphotransferase (APT) family kinase protein